MKIKSHSLNLAVLPVLATALCFAASASAEVIQAEDYNAYYDTSAGNTGGAYRNDDVDIEATGDDGGGYNVGWIEAGEWLSYENITIPSAGNYVLHMRVAAPTGANISLELNAGSVSLDQLVVPASNQGWQDYQTVTTTVSLPAGTHTLGVVANTGGWNFNWLEIVPQTTRSELRIEAEDYTDYADSTTGNTGGAYRNDDVDIQSTADGGYNVGWIVANEWLKYGGVEIASSGMYTIRARVASPNAGAELSLDFNSGTVFLANMLVPNTGGWQNWQVIETDVYMEAGTYDLGVFMVMGGFNLDWLEFVGEGDDSNPPVSEGLTAIQAAAEMGAGFNLGQIFESNQHARTFAAAKPKIDAYYALGYRHVRIPITWTDPRVGSLLVGDPNVGDVITNHPRLAEIEQIVDYALSLPGMYVIINAHHEQALKDGNRWWVLERLWQDITAIFGDRDARLLFQLLNEPHMEDGSAMAPANLRFMSGKAYDKIREVNPERIILIGGNQWFGSGEMAQVWPNLDTVGGGQDPYMMATHHHYEPWEFSGNGQGDYADPWTESDLSDPMQTMAAWANTIGNGMPVYIGEWGVGWGSRYQTMNCNNIRLWYQRMHSVHAAANNMPTTVWDDGGWFKIFDHATNSFDNNLAVCIINGECAWDGAERFNTACN